MNPQRALLALLGIWVLIGDAWQDYQTLSGGAAAVAAAVRTVLLVLTLVALVKPTRPLVLLCLISLTLALVRRALYLGPLFDNQSWQLLFGPLYSGFDLAFRLALLGWALTWLRGRSDDSR
jgi:hypothetical protein